MTLLSWLTLVGICFCGAMSPGPSLVVILQNRVQRGVNAALIASWTHALGIFLWALAASTTLGTLFYRIPVIKTYLTLAGAAFLIYLAYKTVQSTIPGDGTLKNQLPTAWLSGLSISLFNPKVFIFFTALFSQFIPADASLITLLGMATIAGLVDGIWYSITSMLVGFIKYENIMRRHSRFLNRVTAFFYVTIAALSLSQIIIPSI